MPTIDSDTHVIETDRTWEYMTKAEAEFKPRFVVEPDPPPGLKFSLKGSGQFWMIDGKIHPRQLFDPEKTRTPSASRELLDVGARLRHMDELGTDIQIMYPTLFLFRVASRPEVELALCRSYNRWLAEVWKDSKDRLRWVVNPPLRSMDKALEELRFGKQNGACGVFMLGVYEDMLPIDPYFFPIYEEARRLDMPICFHSGSASVTFEQMFPDVETLIWSAKAPTIAAFHTLLLSQIPDKFPNLRWAFVEASGSFIPFVLHDLRARYQRIYGKQLQMENVLQDNRFYVTCQTDDDLPYVLKYAGQQNLVMGTDYGHADTASELEALKILEKDADISSDAKHKVLDDNARALYGI